MDKYKHCIELIKSSSFQELDLFLKENVDSDDPELWSFWGVAKVNLNEPELANDYFKRSVELSPGSLHHFLNYFTSCFPLKKSKFALEYLVRLVPGLEAKEVCELLIPNIYEGLFSCDISLIDIPKELYPFMIFNENPVEYILSNFDKVKRAILDDLEGSESDEHLINKVLKMNQEKRIEIIKLIMAMGLIYGNNDLSSMGLEKIQPDNPHFEKLIISSAESAHNLMNAYTLEGESFNTMVEKVLPHEHMFGFFKSLVILAVAQRFDVITPTNSDPGEEKIFQEYLSDLLSFEDCKCIKDVFDRAELIADHLISNWKIITPLGEHRFLGLEFYIYIPNVFEDSAVHCRDEQFNSSTFYFHTKSKFPKWSPPIFNRHGVDITCGSREKGIYGGVLIRHISGENSHDGSGRALRGIVRGNKGFEAIPRGSLEANWSQEEKDFFKRMNNHSIFGGDLKLVYDPIQPKLKIKPCRRVGVENTSHGELNLRFICELSDEFKKVA